MIHKKLYNIAKLTVIEINTILIKMKTTIVIIDENNYTNEIFNKVKLLAFQYIGFFSIKIFKIFVNKFCLLNLY